MKSLLILLLLITPLYYVRAHPIEAEHGGDHDDDNHISAKSGEEHAEVFEKKEVAEDAAEADSDTDPVENEVVEEVEETNEEGDICEDEDVKQNEEKEDDGEEENDVEPTTEVTTLTSKDPEAGPHKVDKRATKNGHGHRLSDKHQIQTRDKRSVDEDSEDADEELNRRRRSAESDEDEEDKSLEHGEYHGHAERKRRDTSGSEEEEDHERFKRHIAHHILGHEHYNIGDQDRRSVHHVHRDEDASELPHFASDAVEHVDSVAVRVKRVSRAGSSHKPRVMHKNKGNSRAGQNETGIEDEQNITSI